MQSARLVRLCSRDRRSRQTRARYHINQPSASRCLISTEPPTAQPTAFLSLSLPDLSLPLTVRLTCSPPISFRIPVPVPCSLLPFLLPIMSVAAGLSLSLSSRLPLTSGQSIPMLGLGTWRSPPGLVQSAVTSALLCGYRHLDCAWTYENEGGGGRRHPPTLIAAHRFLPPPPHPRRSLPHLQGLEQPTTAPPPRRLLPRVPQPASAVGLPRPLPHPLARGLQAHPRQQVRRERGPRPTATTRSVTREEVWRAMESLVDAGLVRALGRVQPHLRAGARTSSRYARHKRRHCNQVEAHPYFNQADPARASWHSHRIPPHRLLAAGQPASGTRRTRRKTPLNDPVIQRQVGTAEVGKTPAQIILRWHLQLGHIVIPKSRERGAVEGEHADVYRVGAGCEEQMGQRQRAGQEV